MERQKDGIYVKKGPWTVEEDEILMNYVDKFGPRDWSSLRSKGLLPRTGKSCRLRWVNKLQPNLKTGCKFTSEEERVVIDLQAQFGNKWAKIATYLPGRTDNDVKNFWSTRRKRLERMLQTPSEKSQKNKQKVSESQGIIIHELPTLEIPSSSSFQLEQSSTWKEHFQNNFPLGNSEMHEMVSFPDIEETSMLKLENDNQIFGVSSIHMTEEPLYHPFSYHNISPLTQLTQEIPISEYCQELELNPTHSYLLEAGEPLESRSSPPFTSSSMPIEKEIKAESSLEVKKEIPDYATQDTFIGDLDFSSDLFDFFDQPPTSMSFKSSNDKLFD